MEALRWAESETRETNHVNGGACSRDEVAVVVVVVVEEVCVSVDRVYRPLLKKLLFMRVLLLLLRSFNTLMLLPSLGLMCVFTLEIDGVVRVDDVDEDSNDGPLCVDDKILLPTSHTLPAIFVVVLFLLLALLLLVLVFDFDLLFNVLLVL